MDYRQLLRSNFAAAGNFRILHRLHAVLIVSGEFVHVSCHVIDLYSSHGDLRSAELSFLSLPRKTSRCFNSLISCYVSHNLPHFAFSSLRRLLSSSARPDRFTFPVSLKACRSIRDGAELHCLILKLGFNRNVFVSASLIHLYSKYGDINSARSVFDQMTVRDSGSWNALVSALCRNGEASEALCVFEDMVIEGVGVDSITVASILPVCAPLGNFLMGVWLHVYVIKNGIESDIFVSNALIVMYSKSGFLKDTQQIFDEMREKDLVTWNSLISAYEQASEPYKAIFYYDEMKSFGVHPDPLTIVSLASAMAQCGDIRNGKSVHGYVVRRGWDVEDVFVGNAIVDMYAKSVKIKLARAVFDNMLVRDVISWNTLITGYSQNGLATEAIEAFDEMVRFAGIALVQGTLVSVLPAYSHVGALQHGMKIHGQSIRLGLEMDVFLGTCLIDLYSKCGKLPDAMFLFKQVPRKSSCPWNAVISGQGIHGHGEKALGLFYEMQKEGVVPDGVTFVSLLSACSHAGLVEEGKQCFHLMQSKYGIQPVVKHYACMVDLFGRAGDLDAAYEFIRTMPLKPDAGVWGALLGACKIHGNVELGNLASTFLFEVDPENVGYYVLLSNMYARVGRWDAVNEVRSLVKHKKLWKTPGWSSIEVNNEVNVFFTGDSSHPRYEEISTELSVLSSKIKNVGYVPDFSFVLQDVEEDEKQHILSSHSERLAIAFGIISTSLESPIKIFKNLRVCGDCHNATKYISLVTSREIILRDSNRFHHFKEGNCSCGDYW